MVMKIIAPILYLSPGSITHECAGASSGWYEVRNYPAENEENQRRLLYFPIPTLDKRLLLIPHHDLRIRFSAPPHSGHDLFRISSVLILSRFTAPSAIVRWSPCSQEQDRARVQGKGARHHGPYPSPELQAASALPFANSLAS